MNFAHPLTTAQRAQIVDQTGLALARVIDVPVHVDVACPFAPQAAALVDAVGLSAEAWQTLMQQSVDAGTLEPTSMAIPYGNLATMHGKLGHTKESNDFAAMASKLESITQQQQGTIRR